jgi:hypothetical protein
MATRSGYDTFRRVLAPIGLVLGLAFLAHQTCRGEENADVQFTVDTGDDPAVSRVRVDLWADGESIGFYERDVSVPGALRWEQPVPDSDLEATISLTYRDGRIVELRRKVHAEGGARVTIDATP